MSRIGYYLLSKWGKDEVECRVREEIRKRGLRHKDDLWFELDIKRSTYYKVMARNKPVEKDTIALILEPLALDTEDKRFYAYEEARGESDAGTQGEASAYFVRDTQTEKEVRVCFEPLTASDKAILRRDDWQEARFQDAWLQTAEHGVGWKLTLCEGEDKSILGLIRLGTAPQLNGDKGALSGSLLESAPVHQHGTAQRGYKGIGRVSDSATC